MRDGIDAADAGNGYKARRPLVSGSGPILIELHQRLGLAVIDLQTLAYGGFLVVIALNQWLASDVILALGFGWIEFHMIGAAARHMDASSAHPINDVFIGNSDFEYRI